MAEHLTDEEQLEAIKRWWKTHGMQWVLVVAIAGAAWFGWHFWQNKQTQRTQDSSLIYNAMLDAAAQWEQSPSDELAQTISNHAETLKSLSKNSQYAYYGALMLAKLSVADEQLDAAAAELRWVMESARALPLQRLARLRLARVESARDNQQQALDLLAVADAGEFAPLYEEAKGDIHVLLGDTQAARAAYQAALDGLGAVDVRSRAIIELKLNDVMVDAENSVPQDTSEENT